MININIKSTNFEMTQNIESIIREKISLVERFIDVSDETPVARVEIEKSTHHKKGEVYRTEVNLNYKGKTIRVENRNFDVVVSIDEARQELEKRIRRGKGKHFDVFLKGARKLKSLLRKENNE
jgi:ribosomal subunit interface protein